MPLDSRNLTHKNDENLEIGEFSKSEDKGDLRSTLKKGYTYYWGEGLSHFFYRIGGGSQHVRSFIRKENKKLLLISPGRGESSLKYSEVCLELKSAGFDIIVVDHRGQGFSERSSTIGNLGHIEEFGFYSDDLNSICSHFKERKETDGKPYEKTLLLAHSMGCVAGIYGQLNDERFCDGMILSSPMIKVHTAGVPHTIAKVFLKLIKMSFLKIRCVKGSAAREMPKVFKGNILTQCQQRFDFFKYLEKRHPQIKCGPPTFGWLSEAVGVTRRVFKNAQKLEIPILVMQAESDELVCNKAQDKFVHRLKNGRLIRLKESKHEILQERSSIRNRAFVQIHKFLKEI